MVNCEFRIGATGKLNTTSVGELSVAATHPICQIMAAGPEAWDPRCELPDFSTEDCPIAQFQKGAIDLSTTNIRLEAIFEARKKPF